jgi:hypothetical protein
MKPLTCTAAEIAATLRLKVEELPDVIKRHPDFPAADSNGLYSRAEVFAFLDRKSKEGKIGELIRRHETGPLN